MKVKNEKFYVLVFTESGPKYVTGLAEHHCAEWKKDEAPIDFTKDFARDIVCGLLCNGFNAVMCELVSFDNVGMEIDSQPYNYRDWSIEWKKN